ncbi:lipoyl domain-containing protein [Haloferax namakaokahaiae]|uniref:Lipoyl domain-containing protein n=1 Tax=Haloferax namakaokahaiae TaxID=1748331 RepID=A0ABD5ZB16_9EURY
MSGDVEVTSASVWPDDAADVDEGYLANWFVNEGSSVSEGEVICEIQVEKVSVDVPAPATGTISEVLVAEGGDFGRSDVLARIESSE